jgi:molecular chaperone GrpE
VTEEHEPWPGEGVKFTDKRRVDPLTGAVREPSVPHDPVSPRPVSPQPVSHEPVADEQGPGVEADDLVEGDLDVTAAAVAEVTADLQRVHAEYANYRKRVDRDRELVRDIAVAGTLAEFLPVLDDIGRAREHSELEGAFKAVGEALEGTVTRLGLEPFGTVGDPFDPVVHEALTHTLSDDVSEATCVAIYQPGYRFAGRVVRPARVGVADPA